MDLFDFVYHHALPTQDKEVNGDYEEGPMETKGLFLVR